MMLFPGYFVCQDCGRTVGRVRKTRRFRLCDACYERVVPKVDTIDRHQVGSPEHQAIIRYWEWYDGMERRYPLPAYRTSRKPSHVPARQTDSFYPLCACGERREEIRHGRGYRGLFGGPFLSECERCSLKRNIEGTMKLSAALHPGWDDEDWLDMFYRTWPRAFEIGLLPDYWYEIRRNGSSG